MGMFISEIVGTFSIPEAHDEATFSGFGMMVGIDNNLNNCNWGSFWWLRMSCHKVCQIGMHCHDFWHVKVETPYLFCQVWSSHVVTISHTHKNSGYFLCNRAPSLHPRHAGTKRASGFHMLPDAAHAASLRSQLASLQLGGDNLTLSLEFPGEAFKLQLLERHKELYMSSKAKT